MFKTISTTRATELTQHTELLFWAFAGLIGLVLALLLTG